MGEPCSGAESFVADRIEALMPSEGIEPGPRECHDAQPGRRYIDWVYERARPHPLGLEVTSLVASVDLKGDRAAEGLSERLSRLAVAEELGGWVVIVATDRDLRRAEGDIVEMLRQAQPIRDHLLESDGVIRPGIYTDADLLKLPRLQWAEFLAAHKRLEDLGIVELKPFRGKRDHFVYAIPMRAGPVGSLRSELEAAVAAKASKLRREEGLERHLGVFVRRWDVSNEVEDTPVPPELPPEIDVLWVLHGWKQDSDRHPVWVARRGETVWRVYLS